MPTSVARLRANLRNGSKSAGPKTDAGKAAAREDAIRRRLYAQRMTLPGVKNGEDFNKLLQSYLDQFQPRDAAESYCVRTMAAADRRVPPSAIEAAVYSNFLNQTLRPFSRPRRGRRQPPQLRFPSAPLGPPEERGRRTSRRP